MPPLYPVPDLSLPKTSKPFLGGTATSITVHVALLIAVIWTGDRAPDEAFRAGGGAGPLGGGGGGGSLITYVELPAFASSSPPRAEPEPPRRARNVPIPEPQLRDIPKETRPLNLRPPTGPIAAAIDSGRGAGSGAGSGSGSGSGSGTGTGRGAGTGSGQGPGTGGSGGAGFGPTLQQALIPPSDWPDEVRGQAYKVRFWVDERGRVTRVEVEPRIPDSAYRKKFLDKMREYVFSPARKGDGTAVAASVEIRILF